MESRFVDFCRELYQMRKIIFDDLNEDQKSLLVSYYLNDYVEDGDKLEPLYESEDCDQLMQIISESMRSMRKSNEIGDKVKEMFIDYYIEMAKEKFLEYKEFLELKYDDFEDKASDEFEHYVIHTSNLRYQESKQRS